MRSPGDIKIEDFSYDLPKERIAQHPFKERDQSRIVVSSSKSLFEDTFLFLPDLLPKNSILYLNETKVVQARLIFRKSTGAYIEIFLLDPIHPHTDFQLILQSGSPCRWNALVGNRKRWKSGPLIIHSSKNESEILLQANLIISEGDSSVIDLSWSPGNMPFSRILEIFGNTPLPPYIERKSSESDKQTYQTLYARAEGSVAAPTAGLHFTEHVFKGLANRGIDIKKVILHVGAGTFKPVTSTTLYGHEMHSEQVEIPLTTIQSLMDSLDKTKVMVGTTTTRVIESLYWQGIKWLNQSTVGSQESVPSLPTMQVLQWDPYNLPDDIAVSDALKEVSTRLVRAGLSSLKGSTQLLIAPGYKFKFTDALITNFHMPQSTLLLLISALTGDRWRKVYDYALANGFRFLSYGDSCLFIRK